VIVGPSGCPQYARCSLAAGTLSITRPEEIRMATRTTQTIVAVFDDADGARDAVDELNRAGFGDDIGFVAVEREGRIVERPVGGLDYTKADEGAVAGTAIGAGAGALWSIAAVAGVVPAIGPVIAGGLLAAVLGGALGGAAAGGVIGALIGAGIGEDDAKLYERELRKGRTIVAVRQQDHPTEAEAILARHGGRTNVPR
jgi:hypothetical protein